MGTVIIAGLVVAILAIVFLIIRRESSPKIDILPETTTLGPRPQQEPEGESAVQLPSAPSIAEFRQGPTISISIDPSVDSLSLVPGEFVVLDLETTGLSPETNEIIEIGAIRVNRKSDRHPTFQSLVKPGERLPAKIIQLTGITQAMVDSEGLPPSVVLAQLKEFVGDLPIVTFNAAFDMGFIWKAAKRHEVPMNNRYACALKLARRAYPGLSSYRLADLAKIGKLSDKHTHRALGDCMRTAPIFMASVMKIGEKMIWEVPRVDWRVSAQYHKERDANRPSLPKHELLKQAILN